MSIRQPHELHPFVDNPEEDSNSSNRIRILVRLLSRGAVAMYDDDDDPIPAGPKPPRPSDPSEAIFRWIGLFAGLGVCAFMTLFS